MTRTKEKSTEAAVREIRRRTRRKFAPEEKVRIVLEGLRGEQSISEMCCREGIDSNLYYRWSKDIPWRAAPRSIGRSWGCSRSAPRTRGFASFDKFLAECLSFRSPGPSCTLTMAG